jgi:hypothetical protein
MNRDELLAGFRYRTKPRLFRQPLVILQVSERVPVNYDPSDPRDLGPYAYTDRWRDATPDDLIRALAAQQPSGAMTGE